mmetsp:Transcript_25950/g.51163  ORF Transcript_25950/g.51163 Transcript_25950/m.51163 type:complete len:238 (+) Transcript_25950:3648-4361(+)
MGLVTGSKGFELLLQARHRARHLLRRALLLKEADFGGQGSSFGVEEIDLGVQFGYHLLQLFHIMVGLHLVKVGPLLDQTTQPIDFLLPCCQLTLHILFPDRQLLLSRHPLCQLLLRVAQTRKKGLVQGYSRGGGDRRDLHMHLGREGVCNCLALGHKNFFVLHHRFQFVLEVVDGSFPFFQQPCFLSVQELQVVVRSFKLSQLGRSLTFLLVLPFCLFNQVEMQGVVCAQQPLVLPS